jgi:transcription elongation factor GreA
MNQPIFLTNKAFNSLLANLVELEEGMGEIIEVFFREPSKEAEDLKKVLKDYVRWMDEMVKRITIAATSDNEFPYAVIGSEVIVAEKGGGGTYSYRLVSPLRNKGGSNEISFLSPMGKAMLLKKINQNFIVEAPGGNFEYTILDIKITEESNCRDSTSIIGDQLEESRETKQSNIV